MVETIMADLCKPDRKFLICLCLLGLFQSSITKVKLGCTICAGRRNPF